RCYSGLRPRFLGPARVLGPGPGPLGWPGLGRATAAALLPPGTAAGSAAASTAARSPTADATKSAGAVRPRPATARRDPRLFAFPARNLRRERGAEMAQRGAGADRHRSPER